MKGDNLKEELLKSKSLQDKLEEEVTYVGRVVGLKYLPNNFFKPAEPETKHNCKNKAHVMIDLLVNEGEETVLYPVLINPVSVVGFVEKLYVEHPEIKEFALKIVTKKKETNANGTFIPCQFFTKKF